MSDDPVLRCPDCGRQLRWPPRFGDPPVATPICPDCSRPIVVPPAPALDLEPFVNRIAGVWAPDLPSVRARVRALLEEVTIATVREYAGAVSELVEAATGGTAIGRWERRTVIAALRLFQSEHLQLLSFEPVPPQPARMHTFKREDPPLSSAEIDALCARLGEAPAAPVRSLFDVDLEAYERTPPAVPSRSDGWTFVVAAINAIGEISKTEAIDGLARVWNTLEFHDRRRPAGFR